jgi:hypothetical protein
MANILCKAQSKSHEKTEARIINVVKVMENRAFYVNMNSKHYATN